MNTQTHPSQKLPTKISTAVKVINLALFGHGLVGGTLINQILESQKNIAKRKGIYLNIFAVANSKCLLLNENGISENWLLNISNQPEGYTVQEVINFAKQHHLENLIAVDNTASTTFIDNYELLVNGGFHLISSNKIANTISFKFYQSLRETLAKNNKAYLYETNVGAGLPLIDTIKLLHLSGENITKITGVFSGTLSFLFNNFSVSNKPFSAILQQAIENGFTEPDPREDLSGNDVARKLLVLARELELENEFNEIKIQNLIPEALQSLSINDFLSQTQQLDPYYQDLKNKLEANHVLRYVGELSGDLQQSKGILETKLIAVSAFSALGQLKGSDSIFEIYTESYGDNPIIIQGAGAGAKVTARGVFGDILRLASKN